MMPAAEPTSVEARIKLISTTRPLMGIGIVQNKKAESLVIPTDMFSDEVIYRGNAHFELVELTAVAKPLEPKITAPEDTVVTSKRTSRGVKAKPPTHDYAAAGKPPLAWIDLPTNQGRLNLILLVTPGRDNGIAAINDTPGSFPPGSNRYLNLCTFPVKVQTPAGAHSIAPGTSKVFRPGAKDTDYYDLQMMTSLDLTEKLVFSARVFHIENVRKLYLLLPAPSNDGMILVRDVEDRPPSDKAKTLSTSGPKTAK